MTNCIVQYSDCVNECVPYSVQYRYVYCVKCTVLACVVCTVQYSDCLYEFVQNSDWVHECVLYTVLYSVQCKVYTTGICVLCGSVCSTVYSACMCTVYSACMCTVYVQYKHSMCVGVNHPRLYDVRKLCRIVIITLSHMYKLWIKKNVIENYLGEQRAPNLPDFVGQFNFV